MPAPGATEPISARDLDVLEFVARFGVVPRDAVALWAGTARSMTARRERRLREARLVEVITLLDGQDPVLIATEAGLAACGRPELRPARLSLRTLRHFAVAARLAARLERDRQRLLSERELCMWERAIGEREFSVRLTNRRHHRPDLVLLGERHSPIEVELSHKSAPRLDAIVAAWAEAVRRGRFEQVLYRCSPQALPYVERAVARVGAAARVAVELLPEDSLTSCTAPSPPLRPAQERLTPALPRPGHALPALRHRAP